MTVSQLNIENLIYNNLQIVRRNLCQQFITVYWQLHYYTSPSPTNQQSQVDLESGNGKVILVNTTSTYRVCETDLNLLRIGQSSC